MPAEFDQYAKQYAELLKDPVRDAFAPGSEFFALRKWLLIRDFYKAKARDSGRDRWLDVGCGTGELLRMAGSHFCDAHGCDISADMIAAAPDLPIRVQQSTTTLPYEDASFDLVTAVCVFHHVEKPLRRDLISDMARVLKPGGLACIIEHNPFNPVTQLIVRRTPIDANAELLTAGLTRRLLADGNLPIVHSEFFLYLPEAMYKRAGGVEGLFRKVPLGGQYAVFGCKASAPNVPGSAKP